MSECLTKEQSEECFRAGFMSMLNEKVAAGGFAIAPYLKDFASIGGSLVNGAKNLWGAAKDSMILGGSTGVLGALGYDVIKEQLTQDDPKVKLRDDIKAIYARKAKELEDSKWMERVRGMRDELVRGYKKMTLDEYREKYDALIKALDERRA